MIKSANFKTKCAVTALIVGLASISASQAATIVWTAQTFTDKNQLIFVPDDFITAYNFGSSSDVTVNNINFAGATGSQDDGDFKFSNDGNKLDYSAGDVYNDEAISGLSAANASTLLESFSYDAASGAGWRMTLSNLKVGQAYRIQALVVDDRAAGGIPNRRMHFGPHGNSWGASYDYTSNGGALLVTGTFVADGPTQLFRNGIQGTGAPQINALVFSKSSYVPEPATSMYIGLGMVALAFSRRLRFEKRMKQTSQG